MGFFSRHHKAFRSVIASFGMLFGLLAGCASNPIDNTPTASVAKETSILDIFIKEQYLTSENNHTATACCFNHCKPSCLVCLIYAFSIKQFISSCKKELESELLI